MSGDAGRIAIGRVLAPFGIKGYLRVYLYAEDPRRLKKLTTVLMGPSAVEAKPIEIESVLFQQNGTMVKFASVPDRTAAERLNGLYLFVDEADAVRPRKGSWFVHDLVGCTVQNADGTALGTIASVDRFPAQDIWNVSYQGRIVMIPAVREFIKKVDMGKRTVIVQNVEGFFEA